VVEKYYLRGSPRGIEMNIWCRSIDIIQTFADIVGQQASNKTILGEIERTEKPRERASNTNIRY